MAITKILFLLVCPICLTLTSSNFAFANDSTTNAEALGKTQELLLDPQQRDKAGAESAKAAATMKSAESFVGKEHTSELYDITSEVMGTLTNHTNGNVNSMNDATQKSPLDFIKLLTPEEMAKIEALAKKIESERLPSSTTTPTK